MQVATWARRDLDGWRGGIVPTDMRSSGLGWCGVGAALALAACHAGVGGGPAAPTAGEFNVVERAETGPIHGAGGQGAVPLGRPARPGCAAGTSRAATMRWWATARGRGRRALTAIAVDDEGSAWVSSADETGRWVADKAGELRYATAGSPGDVRRAGAAAAGEEPGRLAGWAGWLFHYDGHRWAIVDGLKGAAVSWLALDDDGATAWVGTRARGLFRADDRCATPAPGGAAVVCDQIVGMATTAAGTRVVAGNVNGDARLFAPHAGRHRRAARAGRHSRRRAGRDGERGAAGRRAVGSEQAYTLRALDPGEPVPSAASGFRRWRRRPRTGPARRSTSRSRGR